MRDDRDEHTKMRDDRDEHIVRDDRDEHTRMRDDRDEHIVRDDRDEHIVRDREHTRRGREDDAMTDARVDELALCAACARGDAAAIAELERRYFGEIDRAVRRLDRDGDLVTEVTQRMRYKLFVAGEGPPGIAAFEGRGPLGRWLAVVATREALMFLRATKRERARAHAASELAARDYELHVLRREYRAEFERAFADALAALRSKDRNLLYYHLVGGLGIDRIGALYKVHRVTAFRWLRDAREALVMRTRELLAERMHLAADELDSLLRLVQSRASVSVERLLRQARTDSIPA